MELKAFRIEHFRSIRDTGWQPLSVDRVTALVGQNESGKSSIIDALTVGYGVRHVIDPDDFRYAEALPKVSLEIALDADDLASLAETQEDERYEPAIRSVLGAKRIVVVSKIIPDGTKFARSFGLSGQLVRDLQGKVEIIDKRIAHDAGPGEPPGSKFSMDSLRKELWRCIPDFFLFKEVRSSLPNRIDITGEEFAPGETGVRGAKNFLVSASLTLKDLVTADPRSLGTLLGRANARITRDLQAFWSQYLGLDRKIGLECELKNYGAEAGEKAGAPYLVFWVREGDERLYPSQRSRGTRWFISFFLQLMAEKVDSPGANVFLLDEPATYLHPSAQADVIRLIEQIAEECPVIYSTHSPFLLDQKKLHRVLAVERSSVDEQGVSNTAVKRGLELATASPLTLAPILGLIGVDLGKQSVIKESRNIILEEISAFYYLDAFRVILGDAREFNFVAASGADNVALMYDLMVAWRLHFAVLVDDDPHGKQVCRAIKSKYQLSDEEASKILLRIEGCNGVEDAFDKSDFVAHVCASIPEEDQPISLMVKKMKLSKPMLAVEFWRRVVSGEVRRTNIGTETLRRFELLFDRLHSALT